MLTAADVTACLVTRGDQPEMMRAIREALIFEQVVVWDNSSAPYDAKTAGRFFACELARTDVVYFQDDDVMVPPSTQEALLSAYEPGIPTCNYAHGVTPDGFDDVPLYGAGALVDVAMARKAAARYMAAYPDDGDGFDYYCDFAVGVLYPMFKEVRLPFQIVHAIAQDSSRLCNQPWAAEMKQRVTDQARAIRDRVVVTA